MKAAIKYSAVVMKGHADSQQNNKTSSSAMAERLQEA